MTERIDFEHAIDHDVKCAMSLITTEEHVDGHINELFKGWIDGLLRVFHLELELSKDMFQDFRISKSGLR